MITISAAVRPALQLHVLWNTPRVLRAPFSTPRGPLSTAGRHTQTSGRPLYALQAACLAEPHAPQTAVVLGAGNQARAASCGRE